MTKQEKTALNMARFIRSQTLTLLEKLNELDADEQADICESLHDHADELYRSWIVGAALYLVCLPALRRGAWSRATST